MLVKPAMSRAAICGRGGILVPLTYLMRKEFS